MIEIIAKGGMAANIVANAAIGIRLLWLAAHTRQLPELLFGGGCLGFGVGSVVVVAGAGLLGGDPVLGRTLIYVGTGLTSAGAAFTAVGAWRIFSPNSTPSAVFAKSMCLALAATWIAVLVEDGIADPTHSAFYRIGLAMRIAALGWLGTKSLSYAVLLRRRVALGLAEPLMIARFSLWGVAAVGAALCLLLYGATVAVGLHVDALPALMALLGALGLISAFALALAFFPAPHMRTWMNSWAARRREAAGE